MEQFDFEQCWLCNNLDNLRSSVHFPEIVKQNHTYSILCEKGRYMEARFCFECGVSMQSIDKKLLTSSKCNCDLIQRSLKTTDNPIVLDIESKRVEYVSPEIVYNLLYCLSCGGILSKRRTGPPADTTKLTKKFEELGESDSFLFLEKGDYLDVFKQEINSAKLRFYRVPPEVVIDLPEEITNIIRRAGSAESVSKIYKALGEPDKDLEFENSRNRRKLLIYNGKSTNYKFTVQEFSGGKFNCNLVIF